MHRTLLALATAAIATGATAQEWTGPFVGLGIGAVAGHASIYWWPKTPQQLSGLGGDLRGGYLWQDGQLVYGAEVMLSPVPIVRRNHSPVVGAWNQQAIDASATIRARAGIAFDRFLPYVAVGISAASTSYSTNIDPAVYSGALGAHVAAGVEWRATDQLSIGLEAGITGYSDSTWVYPAMATYRGSFSPATIMMTTNFHF